MLFLPAIMFTDLLYRVVMVHGLVKAIRQPTVDSCRWTSPARLQNAAVDAAPDAEPLGSPATGSRVHPIPASSFGRTAQARSHPARVPAP